MLAWRVSFAFSDACYFFVSSLYLIVSSFAHLCLSTPIYAPFLLAGLFAALHGRLHPFLCRRVRSLSRRAVVALSCLLSFLPLSPAWLYISFGSSFKSSSPCHPSRISPFFLLLCPSVYLFCFRLVDTVFRVRKSVTVKRLTFP